MGHYTNELRDEAIADAADKHAARITKELAAGSAALISDVFYTWIDVMTEQEGAALVQAFANSPDAAGAALTVQLAKIVRDMADIEGVKQIEQAEALARDSADDDRIEAHIWNRNMRAAEVV